jgi:hypothetical protein
MKRVNISFIDAPPFTRLVLGCSWAAVAGLAVLVAWLAVDALATRQDLPVLSRRLANLEHQYRVAADAREEPPASGELGSMRSRVTRLNDVSVVRGLSSAEILAWLESHMSEDVRLVSFHHKAREAEVLLVAEAANAAVLTGFLSMLEREPQFKEVLLSKQASSTRDAIQSVQFEIKVRLKA